MTTRRFDIVLFGATGFTGKLVAEYLAGAAPRDLRWALAGRNREKLEAVRRDLGAIASAAADLPILVADADDERALAELVPQTTVICTTVGPYMKYGAKLAAACARAGTHYCDLTGEVPFMRASIDANHEAAKASGSRIVHACGFDSIPSDLGVLMAFDHAKRVHGRGLSWAKCYAGPSRGGVSGGTVASMLTIAEEAQRDRGMRKLVFDPFGLDPEPRRKDDGSQRDPRKVTWDEDLGAWVGPFFMGVVNSRVVRRSDALVDHYGDGFRYTELWSFGKGARGYATASAVTYGLGATLAAAMVPATRKLLELTVLPAPGEGPSREAIERGFFKWKVLAETEPGEGGRRVRLAGRIEGKRDPGYGATARMLGEAAMCLAHDEAELPKAAGVLTPATAMGMRLVSRLRAAGMVFEIGDAAT
jgi:short subunit dehydrogenase-like uncharacterized protein